MKERKPHEARILALIEVAEWALARADVACDASGVGPFRKRVHVLALECRRVHLDGFVDISKRPRKARP